MRNLQFYVSGKRPMVCEYPISGQITIITSVNIFIKGTRKLDNKKISIKIIDHTMCLKLWYICTYICMYMHPYIHIGSQIYIIWKYVGNKIVYVQTEYSHFGPSRDFINVLNSSQDMSALYDVSKLFQMFAPYPLYVVHVDISRVRFTKRD